MIKFTPCLPKHKSTIVLLQNKCMLCISCHFILLQPLTLRVDHAKLLDVLTSLLVSQAILPRAVCFATSRPANHAICSFIDSSGYASGSIRIRLFIDYIINRFIALNDVYYMSSVVAACFHKQNQTTDSLTNLTLNFQFFSAGSPTDRNSTLRERERES